MDMFSDVALALVPLLMLVSLILVGIYNSKVYPFLLLMALPAACIGSLLLLRLSGGLLDLPALTGLLTLAGITVANVIVLLDWMYSCSMISK